MGSTATATVSPKKAKKEPGKVLYFVHPKHRFEMRWDFIKQYVGKEPAWGPVGKVAYVRTYARELRGPELIAHLMRDLGMDRKQAREESRTLKVKREEFWQTARRVVEFVQTVFKQTALTGHHPWDDEEAHEKAEEMFRRLWAFKWLPPGRGLQFAGTPVVEVKGGAVMNNCGFKSTRNIGKPGKFADAFTVIMDFLMLGVGMGSDVQGAGTFVVKAPRYSYDSYVVEDSREGWVDALRVKLMAYAGECDMPSLFDMSKVRREGAILKTFGGTASGPGPLIRLLKAVDDILHSLIGKTITVTAIADLINNIGVCVVAGNIRRSAEILIGEHGDQEFAKLKDPSTVRALEAAQSAREAQIDKVYKINCQLATYWKKQSGLSAASSEFLALQDRIDAALKRKKKLLHADSTWSELQTMLSEQPLYTHRWASNNTILCDRGANFDEIGTQIATNGEPGVAFMDNIRAYGRMNGDTSRLPIIQQWLDRDVKGFNPCAEQSLEDDELCCLGELNPNAHDTLEDYLHTIKYAYMYCKAVTLIPTNRPETNRIITKNRRIGLSMMGVFKMYERLGMAECILWWNEAYAEVRKWDKTYSEWLGCNTSIKVTSVKPGGTVPLLVGEEGGMKVPSAEYFFRTMRIEHKSAIVKACSDAGYRVEKDRSSPRTMVIYFPVKDPTKMRTATQVTMWEQMEILAALQAYWSDNMVSNTINFQGHEASQIGHAISAFAHRIKAVSFLPLSTHGYAQAPYIPITQQEYEAAVAKLKPLDLSSAGHEVDEKYCTGETCVAS